MRRRYSSISNIQYPISNKSGQSLIEVLVAFTVSVLIGIALITASLATQKASISARNASQGTKLAQEYLEQIRVIRDIQGYNNTTRFNDSACRIINNSSNIDPKTWDLANCSGSGEVLPPLSNTTFTRKIAVSGSSVNSAPVVVTVTWTEGTNTRTATAQTVISLWCPGNVTGVNASPCP